MSNPFNKLRVHRDEDETEVKTQVKGTTESNLFKEAQKPKRKPKEVTEEKKETVVVETHHDTEGFSVVGKGKKVTKNDENPTDKVFEEKPGKYQGEKPHKHNRSEQNFRVGTKQRVFDRHVSGTGYDKHVKKEGFGGKHTWEGNRREYDDTDYYFEKALNPKAVKEVIVEETHPVEVVKETKTEVKVEEVKPEATTEEKKEGEGDDKDKKKKKKGKKDEVNDEEDEKNKLVIPENAKTMAELKVNVTSKVSKLADKPIEVDLELTDKKENEEVFIEKKAKTGKGKKKAKELDTNEVELNKLVGQSLKIDDGVKGFNKNYNNNNGKYGKNNNNFRFKAEDFPELK